MRQFKKNIFVILFFVAFVYSNRHAPAVSDRHVMQRHYKYYAICIHV